jgi:hypothetical protein
MTSVVNSPGLPWGLLNPALIPCTKLCYREVDVTMGLEESGTTGSGRKARGMGWAHRLTVIGTPKGRSITSTTATG